jgi:hypothetical protein
MTPNKNEQVDSIQPIFIEHLLHRKQEKDVRCLLEANIPDSDFKPPPNQRIQTK